MSERDFDLSRRQALAALGSIGIASAGAGLGTTAYFSDQETFENNALTAGTLDVHIAYEEHYANWSEDETEKLNGTVETVDGAVADGRIGLPTDEGAPTNGSLISVENEHDAEQFLNNTIDDTYPDGHDAGNPLADPCASLPDGAAEPPAVIELSDVKPGDFGEVTLTFALCDNPGFVWTTGSVRSADENGLTEPESDDPDEDGDGDATDPVVVELLDEIRAAIWVDDGDNYQDGDESPAVSGTLREVLAALDSDHGVALSGDTAPTEGGGQADARNCFSASTPHNVVLAWWLPVDHANEMQTDEVTFDVGLYAEQCRHNPGGEPETYPSYQANLGRTGVTDNAGPGPDVTEKWRFDVGDDPAPPVVDTGSDTTVYVGVSPADEDPSIYAVDAQTGMERWSAEFVPIGSTNPSEREAIDRAPFAGEDAIYFGTEAGNLYALDKADGSLLWRRELDVDTGTIDSSPLVLGDTLFVGVNNFQDDEPAFFAIDPSDGSTKWTKSVGTVGEVSSSPAYADGRVYITGDNVDGDNLFAFDLNGTRAWSRNLETDELAVRDGRVYASGSEVVALNAADGTTVWTSSVSTNDPPAVTDDAVYLSGGFEELTALDSNDGSERWTFDLDERSDAAPVVVDDTIVIGREEGFGFFAPPPSRLYGIRPDGTERWRFEDGDAGDFDTEVAAADGTVFAASGSFGEGILYALE